jgi:hypothetical protein
MTITDHYGHAHREHGTAERPRGEGAPRSSTQVDICIATGETAYQKVRHALTVVSGGAV